MSTKIWVGPGAAPNAWTHPDNWSPSGVPSADDDVYFENSSVDCNTVSELDQSGMSGVFDSFNVDQSYTGSIGTAAAELQIKTDVLNIGYHNGPGTPAGSPLLNIDLGATVCAITVSNAGTSVDSSRAPVRLKGSATTNDLTVTKGKVEFGTDTDDITSKLRNVVVSYDTKINTDADVFIGKGVTLSTLLTCYGGDTVIECDCPDTKVHGGTFLFAGTWAGTTAFSSYGGVSTLNSGLATLTNCNVYKGTVDFTKSSNVRTITNASLGIGGVIKFNSSYIVLTNGINAADTSQVQIFTGS